MKKQLLFIIILKCFVLVQANADCTMVSEKSNIFPNTEVASTITTVTCKAKQSDEKLKQLQLQREENDSEPIVIKINPKKKFQKILGFGASVTDACLENLGKLKSQDKDDLLKLLFSEDEGVGLSFLRIPLGSNDFSKGNYTLNDSPDNNPDEDFKHYKGNPYFFKTASFLRTIYKLNPHLQTMLSPWTAPAWMKDTRSLLGGKIEHKYFKHYARYLRKSVLEFQKLGVHIDYMSIMNEPLIDWAEKSWMFPQGFMPVADQEIFLEKHFIPMFEKWGLQPKLLLHDHNWDIGGQVKRLINNPKINKYAEGIAYHCYGGDLSTEKQMLKEFPGKIAFNTECTSQSGKYDEGGSLEWWMRNMSVDAIKHGMSGALGWNLCLDNKGGPTNGGPQTLQGLLTIDPNDANNPVKFNPEFYAIAIASKNVQPNAFKIESTDTDSAELINVAILNPDKSIGVIIRNNSGEAKSIVIKLGANVSQQIWIDGKSAISFKIASHP